MSAQSDSGAVPLEREGVRGFLHAPKGGDARGMVLTHGAGGNCTSPLLAAIANAFCSEGLTVLRCDLPFRQERPKGPPSPAKSARDRAGLKAAIEVLRQIVPGDITLGGHSYGGRQASMLCAEEPDVAQGLLLLSYPLHPPGKPNQLRTEHLTKLRMPAVFVHGTSDPFGSIAEMKRALAMIPAPTTLIVIEGAGHDLRRGRFDLTGIVAALAPQ
jgi:predicted alpha/beta-hydrolase family hydrolase